MSSDKTHVGSVIWFDQKKGFGFVKINDPDSDFNDKDIFVHYSCIHTEQNSYKRLYPGEYVSMDVKHQPNVKGKEYICLNLTGVNGGKLLIENEKYNYKVFNKVERNVNRQDQGHNQDQDQDQDQDQEQDQDQDPEQS